jgi:hypothetical protein
MRVFQKVVQSNECMGRFLGYHRQRAFFLPNVILISPG